MYSKCVVCESRKYKAVSKILEHQINWKYIIKTVLSAVQTVYLIHLTNRRGLLTNLDFISLLTVLPWICFYLFSSETNFADNLTFFVIIYPIPCAISLSIDPEVCEIQRARSVWKILICVFVYGNWICICMGVGVMVPVRVWQ